VVKINNSSIDNKGIYNNYLQIKNDYCNSYDKLSLLNRIVLCIRSCFTNTEKTRFKAAEREAIENFANKYKGKISKLNSQINGLADPHKKLFYQKAMSIVKEKIREMNIEKDFVYRVKNADSGEVGYLVGTIHSDSKLNKNVHITSTVKQAIENSQILITEVKKSTFMRIFGSSTLDMKIMCHAELKRKKMEAFETVLDQVKAAFKLSIDADQIDLSELGFDKPLTFVGLMSDVINHYVLEEWKKGNEISMMELAKQYPDVIIKDRNKKWLNGSNERVGLLERFNQVQTTKEKICVAVGTAHLFGNEGLITQLEKNGFTIERLINENS
jgi:uncharacterized protein YbaP (TraB family)